MKAAPFISRLEDLPYHTSPPIEFTYKSPAVFLNGYYTWADPPTLLTPDRPLMVNSLYYFRTVTMAADIEEADFSSCIVTTPQFQMYRRSQNKSIMFREPIYMLKFLQNFDYRKLWITQQDSDQLYASFNGVLRQNAALVGRSPINLIALISAQEIVDEGYIRKHKEAYPHVLE